MENNSSAEESSMEGVAIAFKAKRQRVLKIQMPFLMAQEA